MNKKWEAFQILDGIILVMKRPIYILCTSLISFTLFSIFILVNNIPLFSSALKISQNFNVILEVFFNAVEMILDVGGPPIFISVVAASVLGGVSISMTIYNILASANKVTNNLMSFGGVFGGALSSSCSACATSFISILGIAGGLTIFPLKGLEFSILSIAILLVSIYFVSKNLSSTNICGVSTMPTK